ncbi:MAG: threonine synthase [Candidatus Neomarinimicrobiota bacterium]|nr:MAG: threonine synthase [Candidatus Neomarinimicrobiota bacterium]
MTGMKKSKPLTTGWDLSATKDIPQAWLGYRCVGCSREFPPEGTPTTCPDCGDNLDAVYDLPYLKRHVSRDRVAVQPFRHHWRYAPLLPVSPPPDPVLAVGATPLIAAPRLATALGLSHLWLKDDSRQPSGSLKDRASDLALRHAHITGHHHLIAASTGNAAASLACLGAAAGKQVTILAPATAPRAKQVQILIYGARLIPVKGSYDTAFDLSLALSRRQHLYCRNTGINPVLTEGKKTVALEIGEQLAWRVPDVVAVPVGDGCILGAVYKGFQEARDLGWVDRVPRLLAVQAAGSDAVVSSWEQDHPVEVQARTVADSIAVNRPRDLTKALRAIRASEGRALRVTDADILEAQQLCARTTGLFGEPAAVTALAGCRQARQLGWIGPDDRVVCLFTGTGLKDIPAAEQQLSWPRAVPPDLDTLLRDGP